MLKKCSSIEVITTLPGFNNNNSPHCVTDYKEVSDGDSVHLDFTLTSASKDGNYIGDGYKTVTIDVANNFNYYINRNVYVSDLVGKANDCYLSLTTGET